MGHSDGAAEHRRVPRVGDGRKSIAWHRQRRGCQGRVGVRRGGSPHPPRDPAHSVADVHLQSKGRGARAQPRPHSSTERTAKVLWRRLASGLVWGHSEAQVQAGRARSHWRHLATHELHGAVALDGGGAPSVVERHKPKAAPHPHEAPTHMASASGARSFETPRGSGGHVHFTKKPCPADIGLARKVLNIFCMSTARPL